MSGDCVSQSMVGWEERNGYDTMGVQVSMNVGMLKRTGGGYLICLWMVVCVRV